MRAVQGYVGGLLTILLIAGCGRVQQAREGSDYAESSESHPAAAPASDGGSASRLGYDANAKYELADARRGSVGATNSVAPAELPAISLTEEQNISQFLESTATTEREAYAHIEENDFLAAQDNPLSTFSIDVDTASYANVRRMLRSGRLPPAGAVRIEELVNYFTYDYPAPADGQPFSVNAEVAACPWRPEHRLLRIGLLGKEIHRRERPASNLVFLVDVSGSMSDENKLPLVKRSLARLVDELGVLDRVAIVTYAGSSGVALPSTSGDEKHRITTVIESLGAGGSTHGSQGIVTAYRTARANFIESGVNRVILCTDGDFNVGVTSESELVDLIEREAQSGVYLSVLGFGTGNFQDSRMEQLADHGNGNYAYIDSFAEACKVLVDQMSATLVTIAKDVKIQLEFNPAAVSAYRLIGYENRQLAAEDFRNDRKDAGEIGAGHTVTALYELIPAGADYVSHAIPELKYQQASSLTPQAQSGELLTVRLRYKQPDDSGVDEFAVAVEDADHSFSRSSRDFQFAAAVASFGMLLRNSPHRGNATWDAVREWAQPAVGRDASGYREEFLELIVRAQQTAERHLSRVR